MAKIADIRAHSGRVLLVYSDFVNRRSFLACAGVAAPLFSSTKGRVIDTHIHLFDPTRPQGVPWPPPTARLIYKQTLPSHFREVSRGLAVVGAIHIEASPWVEDNTWVLEVASKDTAIVGVIGNLEPQKPEFRRQLDKYAADPLFLGIRNGYLWDRNLRQNLQNPELTRGLKELASRRLAMDVANPSVDLLEDVVRVSDVVPDLRIVLDHLPALYPPSEAMLRKRYDEALARLAPRKQVYAKLSSTLRSQNHQKVPTELPHHKDRLDLLYTTFGADRVFYGSDWPNSETSFSYTQGLQIMRDYFSTKDSLANDKFFFRNSVAAYGWKPRTPYQRL